MREKKDKFSIFPFEEDDTFAEYSIWKDDEKQLQYLEKVASQIGWILIEFNRLEWQVHEIIKKYLCNNTLETNAIFFNTVAEKSFSTKVDLLKNFFKIYYKGEKKHMFDQSIFFSDYENLLNGIINKLKDSATLRNKYAHCYWHRMTEDNFVEFKYGINNSDGFHKVFVRFNSLELQQDYNLIEEIQESLYNFEIEFDNIYSST